MAELFQQFQLPSNLQLRPLPVDDLGKNPMFNFATGEFYLNPDGTFIVRDDKSGFANLVRKMLITDRYEYMIYSPYYGSELYKLIGRNLTAEEKKLEVERLIRDALIFDPRIVSVSNFRSTVSGDSISVTFSYTDIKGNTQILELEY